MDNFNSPISYHAYFNRDYSSLAALVFLVLEYSSTFLSEYRYIWSARSPIVKALYILARYLPIASSITNYVLVNRLLAHGPVPEAYCRGWFLSLFLTTMLMVGAMDGVLFLRAFALYERSKVIYGLFIPIVLQFACACVALIPSSQKRGAFNGQCDLVNVPIFRFTIMNVSMVFAHGMLFGTAFAKRKASKSPSSESLVRMVVNEAACIFVFFIGTISSMTPVSLITRTCNPFILFVWPLVVYSTITCRIVLNMRTLHVESADVSNFIPESITTEKANLDLTVVGISFDSESFQEQVWDVHY